MNTVIHRFLSIVDKTPNRNLLTWINSQGKCTPTLTYGSFHQLVKHHSAWLVEQGVCQTDVVILSFNPGIEFYISFFSCLYIGAIPAPVYPINHSQTEEQIATSQAIIKETQANLILSDETYPDTLEQLMSIRWLTFNTSSEQLSTSKPVANSELAFIQYTSGSTQDPKGVMISHANLLHQVSLTQTTLQTTTQSIAVSWVPHYHDLGLISGFIGAIAGQWHLVTMSPFTFIRQPALWFELINQFRATHTAAPNFSFALVNKAISPIQIKRWDLSCLRVVMNAGEPIQPQTIDDFFKRFAKTKLNRKALCPAYGLAENTVGATIFGQTTLHLDKQALLLNQAIISDKNNYTAINSVGKLLKEVPIAIVEDHIALPDNRIGEIWITGDSKAMGYYKNKSLSQTVFNAHLENDKRTWLRTGDLGFIHRGELFVTGRIKDLIIINGKNYYPQDIENTVLNAHGLLQPNGSIAYAVNKQHTEGLGFIAEVIDDTLSPTCLDELLTSIRQTIFSAMGIPLESLFIVKKQTIFKTTSGKLQRRKTAAAISQNSFKKRLIAKYFKQSNSLRHR